MFWKKIAPVHWPPGVCCPSARCCVLLLFKVATVTVIVFFLGGPEAVRLHISRVECNSQKTVSGWLRWWWGLHSASGAADVRVYVCKPTPLRALSLLALLPLCIFTSRHTKTSDQHLSSGQKQMSIARRVQCSVMLLQQHRCSTADDAFSCSLLTPTAYEIRSWVATSFFHQHLRVLPWNTSLKRSLWLTSVYSVKSDTCWDAEYLQTGTWYELFNYSQHCTLCLWLISYSLFIGLIQITTFSLHIFSNFRLFTCVIK